MFQYACVLCELAEHLFSIHLFTNCPMDTHESFGTLENVYNLWIHLNENEAKKKMSVEHWTSFQQYP